MTQRVLPTPVPTVPAAPRSAVRALRLIVPGLGDQLDAGLWHLFLGRVINTFAFTAAFPFLATHLAVERGVPATAVGAIYMAQGVAGGAFQLVGGTLADRVGRRPMLVLSLGLRAVVTLALGVCILHAAPVIVLAALVVSNALLAGLFQPAADAMVVDLTEERGRLAAFAHQRVAINLGWAMGPIAGGLLAGRTSFATVFLVAAPLMVAAAVVMTRLPGRSGGDATREPPWRALSDLGRDRALKLHLVAALLTFLLAGQLIVTLSLDASSRLGLSPADLGLLWTLNGVLVVVLQMPVARFVQRIGTRSALIAGALVYGLGYASVGFAQAPWFLVVSMVTITAGDLLNAPSQQAAVAARATPDRMGRILGLLGLTMMFGRSTGPLLGGAAHDLLGETPRLMWGMVGLLGAVAALVYAHPALAAADSRRDAGRRPRSVA